MAVQLFCNKKEILHLQNASFETLYLMIEQFIENKNLKLSQSIQNLMEKLYMGGFGIGTDIAYSIKTELDIFLFATLVKDAILQIMEEMPRLSKERKIIFWNFYRELIIYGKKLKYNSLISIRYGDKEILHIPKLHFESICNYILGHATNTIIISPNIKKLLQLIVDKYKSVSINLSDYLTTKEDYLLLAEAIKKTLEYMQKFSVELLTEDSKNQLWGFCNELILYEESITSD
ncbi:MAG: hypothetical protein OHK0036_20510 [Bacteroidia bacterium]